MVASELAAVADFFGDRRETILASWRTAVEVDPKLNTASTLSRAQFNDHIPSILDAFERELRRAAAAGAAEAPDSHKDSAAEHGLHRWQHGYNQEEVMREWGHLQLCLLEELENYAAMHPDVEKSSLRNARLALARLCSQGVTESAARYGRLQQSEAVGRMRDLEHALAQLQEAEKGRAQMWHEAAHDLRNKVGVVDSVTEVLHKVPEPAPTNYLTMLQQSVRSLNELLNDLLVLSHLEAGQEQRNVRPFDAAAMLMNLCSTMQPLASERQLFLMFDGPDEFPVQGDPIKIQRIAQNLIVNALKYTERGGVKVTWKGVDTGELDRWELCVQDTGPGFQMAPITEDLKNATDLTQTVENQSELTAGSDGRVEPAPTLPSQSNHRPFFQEPGEGIGLSIVKRLCELLDASLELQTEMGHGSTFRVIFPCRYDSP